MNASAAADSLEHPETIGLPGGQEWGEGQEAGSL